MEDILLNLADMTPEKLQSMSKEELRSMIDRLQAHRSELTKGASKGKVKKSATKKTHTPQSLL